MGVEKGLSLQVAISNGDVSGRGGREGYTCRPTHRTQLVGSYECLSAHSMCIILILGKRTANYESLQNKYNARIVKYFE